MSLVGVYLFRTHFGQFVQDLLYIFHFMYDILRV